MPTLLELERHEEVETSWNNDAEETITTSDRVERSNRRAGALAGVASIALAGTVILGVHQLVSPSSENGVPIFFGNETSTSETKTRETQIRQPKTTYLELDPSLQPGATNP